MESLIPAVVLIIAAGLILVVLKLRVDSSKPESDIEELPDDFTRP